MQEPAVTNRPTLGTDLDDTFMVVWRNARDFRQASRVSTWVIGIAYRTALKSIRNAKYHGCCKTSMIARTIAVILPLNVSSRTGSRKDSIVYLWNSD